MMDTADYDAFAPAYVEENEKACSTSGTNAPRCYAWPVMLRGFECWTPAAATDP